MIALFWITLIHLFTASADVHKFPRVDPPDDPLPESVSLKELVNQEEIQVEGATLRYESGWLFQKRERRCVIPKHLIHIVLFARKLNQAWPISA